MITQSDAYFIIAVIGIAILFCSAVWFIVELKVALQ